VEKDLLSEVTLFFFELFELIFCEAEFFHFCSHDFLWGIGDKCIIREFSLEREDI
jgi:hypothetical protein